MNVIERAERAQRLLNDPLLQEAFDGVRTAILAKFETAPVNDADGMVKLRLCLKLLSDVRANLTAAVNDGKYAEFEINERKRVANLSDFQVSRR